MLLENGEDVDQADMVNVLYFVFIYEILRDSFDAVYTYTS